MIVIILINNNNNNNNNKDFAIKITHKRKIKTKTVLDGVGALNIIKNKGQDQYTERIPGLVVIPLGFKQ